MDTPEFNPVEPSEAHLRALDATASIISTALHNRALDLKDVPNHVPGIFQALLASVTGTDKPAEPEPAPKPTPKEIRASINPDFLVSFEDGKQYKTLKRHLTIRGLTPEQYRQKHGLPIDYPMVASNYAAQRSELAKSIGLGRTANRQPAGADA